MQLCNSKSLYLNADADAIPNAEMPIMRFLNGLLLIYQGPLTLLNFQMAACEPLKIDVLCLHKIFYDLHRG